MRSGFMCVLLVLLIRKGAGEDDFRPMPIPLNEWHEVRGWRGQRAGTLQEALHAPAHYWEDALRHSVYLTLVRDKIDHLIAKGDYIDQSTNDLDDRDLWDKVKRAPFERANNEDPTMVGDVVMMAKGKLMEENGGFRFKEDDKFKDKCTEKCMDGVKALWSVKRIRQTDSDVTGRYHYELTFSVITHKKYKKHEKPMRTFTVRETAPERIEDAPLENRYYEPTSAPTVPVPVPVAIPVQPPRADRALWVHRNIGTRSQARQHSNGLDRLFSSLFSDDDDDDIPPPRYKPKQYYNQYNPPPPIYQQYSKAGYVGSTNDQQKAGYVGSPSEQHHQKKLVPHKPYHVYKYNQYGRPIPPPPPPHHQHYLDIEQIGVVSAPYHQDHRYGPSNKPGKTSRPPVLPTPPNPVLPQKNFTIETTTPLKPNSEETTQKPDVHPPKTYNKHKPTTVKISYLSDHIRPPVYNAPPGVFVTMDKKPFKPMPPLRLVHSSKFHKAPRPTDFRPSPQVLDVSSFSEPDPLVDTAFRPITMNYANSNTTEKAVAASDNHFRKSNSTLKKVPKKNEIVNAQRVTTPAPEIITAHSVDADSDSDAEWTNVLGAFAKTTPMAADSAEKEKAKIPETTTPMTTTTVSTTTTTTPAPTISTKRPPKRTTKTTTTEAPTTTAKPKKRTRPPPKFTKPEKVKKHKRIITTTTTTEAPHKRKEQDLTPQASSASATAQSTTTTSTTTTTTTTTPEPTTTTTQTTTTTTQASTTTEAPSPAPETEAPKTKSRYRQSTLKYRSVLTGHDKKEEKARTIIPPTGVIPPRRKGTKYQNYLTSTPKFSDMQFDDEGREDHVVSPYKSKSISTTESVTNNHASKPTTPEYEEVADHVYITSESSEYSFGHDEDEFDDTDEREDEQESRETSKILPSTSALVTPNETTNEIVEIEYEPEITAEVVTTPSSSAKNKTKCKKKKLHTHNNTTEEVKTEEWRAEESQVHETISAERPEERTEDSKPEQRLEEKKSEDRSEHNKTKDKTSEEADLAVQALEQPTSTISTTTTTQPSSTPDIFEEIFGGFTFHDSVTESKSNETSTLDEQESTNQKQFIKAEDDFADFFEAFDDKHRQHRDAKYDDEYEYDDKEHLSDDDEFHYPSEDDRRGSRDTKDEEETYDEYQERGPYSLLELMAME